MVFLFLGMRNVDFLFFSVTRNEVFFFLRNQICSFLFLGMRIVVFSFFQELEMWFFFR